MRLITKSDQAGSKGDMTVSRRVSPLKRARPYGEYRLRLR